MAIPFTKVQKQEILQSLKQTAKQYMMMYGIKNTTVDMLVKSANISKGAFYIFYNSKYELFFEILEDMHEDMFNKAYEIMEFSTKKESDALVDILICCFEEMSKYLKSDMGYSSLGSLLKNIPEKTMLEHKKKEAKQIQNFISKYNLKFKFNIDKLDNIISSLYILYSCNLNLGYDLESCKFVISSTVQNLFERS